MTSAPAAPAWRDDPGKLAAAYYGCGWMVRPTGGSGGVNTWHSGSLPGTTALMVQRHDGIGYVALFNQRSDRSREGDNAIDPMLYRAADAVTDWP
jgi:hypothetical protein